METQAVLTGYLRREFAPVDFAGVTLCIFSSSPLFWANVGGETRITFNSCFTVLIKPGFIEVIASRGLSSVLGKSKRMLREGSFDSSGEVEDFITTYQNPAKNWLALRAGPVDS